MIKLIYTIAGLLITSCSVAQITGHTQNQLNSGSNTVFTGGTLTEPTSINGDANSLRLVNIDTFLLQGRHIQFFNSTKKTTISSFDSLALRTFGNLLLSASTTTLDGSVKLTGYKNSTSNDSVLSVDDCGNLILVSQNSLQTLSKNAFINGGNAFGAPAYFGTADRNNIYFKTQNIIRGNIDTFGHFNYYYPVNINRAKLKATGDIEINGNQDVANTNYEKATSGLNFVWGNETLPRGTVSFGAASKTINFTAHTGFRFYTLQPGVISKNSLPDLTVIGGLFRFGERYSRLKLEEPSAAYQFHDYIDNYGIPKGILLPRIGQTHLRDLIKAPAVGLMLVNMETNDLEIYKPDGWHKFETSNVKTTSTGTAEVAAEDGSYSSENGFVQPVGNGKAKMFAFNHNLNTTFLIVQFLDCGPEANCNQLINIPKGARVELDGKNRAVVTFDQAPSYNRYKILIHKVL